MGVFTHDRRTGITGAAEWLIRGWALLGGLLILGIVAVNLLEVVTGMTRPWTGYRFTGGVELTEMAVAVAAFAFLPYCQLTDANVTADIFTARAGRSTIALLKLVAAVVALVFAVLLLWRMWLGLGDQRSFRASTTILAVPIWWAFVPILISLALLVVASFITLLEQGRATLSREKR